MADNGRAKIKEVLVRHSELEQSETKAQAALVTVLSLTQVTELKLLLDIGREGHRFYDFVLTLLLASIALEICVGVVIIYIGNLHYHQQAWPPSGGSSLRGGGHGCSPRGGGALCRALEASCACCPAFPRSKSASGGAGGGAGGGYQTVRDAPGVVGETPLRTLDRSSARLITSSTSTEACDWSAERHVTEQSVERADVSAELARVRVAHADVRIVRAHNYVRLVEDALRRAPGGGAGGLGGGETGDPRSAACSNAAGLGGVSVDGMGGAACITSASSSVLGGACSLLGGGEAYLGVSGAEGTAGGVALGVAWGGAGGGAGGGAYAYVELEAELMRAREDAAAAERERAEGEAERRLAEALRQHALRAREGREDRREGATFRRVALWQQVATYLLYFVMLMNIFVTTFGISGGDGRSVFGARDPLDPAGGGATQHASLPPVQHRTLVGYPVLQTNGTMQAVGY